MYKNILVPTDGSPRSLRAIQLAVRLASEQKSRITGVWIGPAWEPNLYAYDRDVPSGFISPRQHSDRVRRLADRRLDAVKRAAQRAGVACQCVYAESMFPYQAILTAAKRNRCDLIVMATHGRRGFARLLLVSESAKVLAHAQIPVLMCR